MSNSVARDDQQLWVLFREAVLWIAYRSLNGIAVGPRPLNQLPDDNEDDEEYNWGVGRRALAEQLLLDRAAKGRIRIYSGSFEANNLADDLADAGSGEVPVDCLVRAELAHKIGIGYTLFIRGDRGLRCDYLAVNYGDLVQQFWGDAAIAIPENTTRPEAGAVPLRRLGRRPRYPWPDFAAELFRRLISGPPIPNQAALERHMLEWCAAEWGAEPAPSEVREWVRPTFQIFARISTRIMPAVNGTIDNPSPEMKEATGN
jgi:hypothetical protein